MKIINARIEDLEVDVMVNAADCHLWIGTGVDGALRMGGGYKYQRACLGFINKQGLLQPGRAYLMKNRGNLKAKYIIHAVAPDHMTKDPYVMLKVLIKRIARLAKRIKAQSVAIPLLGSGAFLLDIDKVYKTIVRAVKRFKGKQLYYIVHPSYKEEI